MFNVQEYRATEWGNWGITFYWKGTPMKFEGKLHFPVGAQGPVDGFLGSPQRQRYINACKDWQERGILPDGCVCDIGQRWLYVQSSRG